MHLFGGNSVAREGADGMPELAHPSPCHEAQLPTAPRAFPKPHFETEAENRAFLVLRSRLRSSLN